MIEHTEEIIRMAFDVESHQAQKDNITGQTPEMWRNNDVKFQLGFFFKEQPITATPYSELKLIVKERENRASTVPLMSKSISADDITPVFTTAEWEAGSAQHGTISFTKEETRLDLRGENSRVFWLAVIAQTSAGKRITLGSTEIKMHHDGDDETGNVPPLGSSIIPEGAAYNGAGVYVLNGLIANRWYSWALGTEDIKLVNGGEELTASGNFNSQGTSVTLHGNPSELVTATIRYPVFATLDELDARYQRKDKPWRSSPNGRYVLLDGVHDDGIDYREVKDLQNL